MENANENQELTQICESCHKHHACDVIKCDCDAEGPVVERNPSSKPEYYQPGN